MPFRMPLSPRSAGSPPSGKPRKTVPPVPPVPPVPLEIVPPVPVELVPPVPLEMVPPVAVELEPPDPVPESDGDISPTRPPHATAKMAEATKVCARVLFPMSDLSWRTEKLLQRFALAGQNSGEGEIRTPDTGFSPYNGLANRRLRPLGHLSRDAWYYLRSRRISSPCFRVSAGGLCPTALVAGDFKNPPISAAGPRHGPSRHETCCPSPASMRSATSQPCGHFGSSTPYPFPRGFAAPSPAPRGEVVSG